MMRTQFFQNPMVCAHPHIGDVSSTMNVVCKTGDTMQAKVKAKMNVKVAFMPENFQRIKPSSQGSSWGGAT